MINVSMRRPALFLVIVLAVATACTGPVATATNQGVARQELAAAAQVQAAPDVSGRAVAAGKDRRIAREELAAPAAAPAMADLAGRAIAEGKDRRIAREELAAAALSADADRQRIARLALGAGTQEQGILDLAGRAMAEGKDQRIAGEELGPSPLTLPSTGSVPALAAENGPVNMRTTASSPALSAAAVTANAASEAGAASARLTGIEPKAGAWKTFLLTSGSQFRPTAPPDKQAARDEIDHLQSLVPQRAAAARQIAYWNDGGPLYRWHQIALEELLRHNANVLIAQRALALVQAAAYDAVIAAWDAKYTYNRPRPSDFDHRITTAIANPDSPSYPSDYAAVAAASSAVLTYVFPDRAQALAEQAAAAGASRLVAGVEYPSDVEAGRALGQQIAALAIARGQSDGSNVPWTGTVPTAPGKWTGTNPVLPAAGTWTTWVLSSGSEFRPGPPPAYNSPEMAAELREVTTFQRTPKQTADGFFWEYGAGGLRSYAFWNQLLAQMVLAHNLAANPPRAARSYLLPNVAAYDAAVGCWDAKYRYWAPRPFQLDPNFKPLFTTPNHPSYPSAHGCISTALGATMAYLFPADAQTVEALAEGASQSRIWAGIHFRSDVAAGQALGAAVAQKVMQRAEADGSNLLRSPQITKPAGR